MTRPSPYPLRTRTRAARCFAKGLGYRATARKIRVPLYTVRDWLRLWKSGDFLTAEYLQPSDSLKE